MQEEMEVLHSLPQVCCKGVGMSYGGSKDGVNCGNHRRWYREYHRRHIGISGDHAVNMVIALEDWRLCGTSNRSKMKE